MRGILYRGDEVESVTQDADIVFFDLETNGLHTGTEILEIGAVKYTHEGLRAGVPEAIFEHLIYFDGTPNPYAFAVNRLSVEELRSGTPVEEALRAFRDFTTGCVIIGHNIWDFDLRILGHHLRRHSVSLEHKGVIDTLLVSRERLLLSSYSLGALSAYFGIKAQPTHRALADVHATAEVFTNLIHMKSIENKRNSDIPPESEYLYE